MYSIAWDSSPHGSPYRKNMCFAWGQIYRADWHENLHDGSRPRALARMWVFPLLMGISLGVSK